MAGLLGYSLERFEREHVPLARKNAARFLYYRDRFFEIEGVSGDIVECGVGKGRSFLMFALLLDIYKVSERLLWGFDSFEGFPEPTSEDESVRKPMLGDSWARVTKIEIVTRRLIRGGLTDLFVEKRTRFVKGFFEDTLHKAPAKIALLHLDVDLYASYKLCLEELYPRVSPGGIIMFDEYQGEGDREKWPGSVKAIDEFSKKHSLAIVFDAPSGKSFIRKPRA
ncbi:MAG: TylF/MycF/NovP-related O-methyltransferase [Patescibacteria group bacterium]